MYMHMLMYIYFWFDHNCIWSRSNVNQMSVYINKSILIAICSSRIDLLGWYSGGSSGRKHYLSADTRRRIRYGNVYAWRFQRYVFNYNLIFYLRYFCLNDYIYVYVILMACSRIHEWFQLTAPSIGRPACFSRVFCRTSWMPTRLLICTAETRVSGNL